VPRAPLPVTRVTRDRVASSTTSKGVTPSSSLLRAAPNQLPPPDFVYPHLFPEVPAGCCEPLLETGSSRRYLCKSFPRMLEPLIPSGGRVHMPVTSPTLVGLPQVPPMGRLPRIAPQRDFVRRVFRDRRYSLRSGLLVCSPPRSPLPLRRSSLRRAAVTFTPEQKSAPLPVQASGILAVRIRQLTAKGLPPF
jgi:hypothetical protein